MTLTGYKFDSLQEIIPFAEDKNGETVGWAKNLSTTFNCYIQIGFPELLDENYYNSIAFISPLSDTPVVTYQKHFLFEDDLKWASEGKGFLSMQIDALPKIGFGICMDLNSKNFIAPFSKYEFGHFHAMNSSKLLLISNAWLLHFDKSQETDSNLLYDGKQSMVNVESIDYWIKRLKPMVDQSLFNKSQFTVIIANRVGNERGSTFCGSSSIIQVNCGKVEVICALGRGCEEVIVADITFVQ